MARLYSEKDEGGEGGDVGDEGTAKPLFTRMQSRRRCHYAFHCGEIRQGMRWGLPPFGWSSTEFLGWTTKRASLKSMNYARIYNHYDATKSQEESTAELDAGYELSLIHI